ncbi:MAG: O-antigen ligase family protein [Pseudomonadota bacterium]
MGLFAVNGLRVDGLRAEGLFAVGVLGFAFFGWLGAAGASIGLGLALISVACRFPVMNIDNRDQLLFWLAASYIFFILVRMMVAEPVDHLASWLNAKYTLSLVLLWCFPLLALGFQGRESLVRASLVLAGCGLMLQVLENTDFANLQEFFSQRQNFGMTFVGFGLFGALSFQFLLFGAATAVPALPSRRRRLVRGGLFVAGLVVFQALLMSQSRAGWVALAAAVLVVGVATAMTKGRRGAFAARTTFAAVAVAGLVSILLLWFNMDRVVSKVQSEADVYARTLSLDREEIPLTSFGRRAHMWLYAVDLIEERPWLGWGIGASPSLLSRDRDLKIHPHFHNSYVEILVEQGIIGLLFYAAVAGLLLTGLFRAYRQGRVPFASWLVLLGGWTTILVWSLANTRIVHADERFVLMLLGAITLSYAIGDDTGKSADG